MTGLLSTPEDVKQMQLRLDLVEIKEPPEKVEGLLYKVGTRRMMIVVHITYRTDLFRSDRSSSHHELRRLHDNFLLVT